MTNHSTADRRAGPIRAGLALLAMACLTLAACGGGGSDNGSANVRVVNATTDVASIDFYASTTNLIAGTAANTVSANAGIGGGSAAIKVTAAGTTASLTAPTTRSFSGGVNYTFVAYGNSSSVALTQLIENETAPDSGNAKLRLLNDAPDAGSLDMYVTASGTDLNAVSPTTLATAPTLPSGFTEVAAGTYRVRITGSGNKADLRLDLPSVTLNNQDIATLIVTTGVGGTLVNGLQLLQGGAITPQLNTQARVRTVASVAGSGAVTATVNGTSLGVALPSPSVGVYTLVTAGAGTPDVSVVGGAPVPVSAQTFAGGGDYTLLVYGTAAAPQLLVSSDDNHLPTITTNGKIRLFNGVNVGNMTLRVSNAPVANNIPYGTISGFSEVTGSSTSGSIIVSTPSGSLYSSATTTSDLILPGGVYTVFMLDGNSTPSYNLLKDR